jgi:hypothetical protein
MEKLVFVVEMKEPIDPEFDAPTFARGIAYRASRWCEQVEVKGENVQIVVSGTQG